MAREVYRRSKSSRRHSKSASHYPSPYRMSSMELFSRMSTEALQAIDETRQEMKKKTIKENVTESQIPPQEAKDPSPAPPIEPVPKDHKTEDNDSAIGTSSLRSNPAVSGETTTPLQPTPPNTPTRPPDKVKPKSSRAFHVMTDAEIKERHESRHPSLRPSQFAQDCINRHMPLVSAPTDARKLSVFDRLSAPVPVSYKPTARQRARARLTLSLSVNNDRRDNLAFGQRREPGIRRDSLKSAFPTILRTLKQEENIKKPERRETCKTAILLNGHRPRQANYPSLSKSYSKMEITDKPEPAPEENCSENSVELIQGKPLHTSRQFEITPMGYDSRYLAMRCDQPLYTDKDFDDCEIISQSKAKCQQWLEQQTTILTNS